MTEEEVIDNIIKGNKSAYSILVEAHKSQTYALAFRIVKNEADAEEVAQDAFIKAYKALGKFDKRSKFSTWLFRIVYNSAISHMRKRKSTLSLNISKHGGLEDNSNSLEENDKKIYITQAMKILKPIDASIITLFYLKEHNIQEIAEILAIKESNVKIKLFRSRQKLADELKRLLSEEVLTL